MKKKIALALLAAMVIALLSGCGTKAVSRAETGAGYYEAEEIAYSMAADTNGASPAMARSKSASPSTELPGNRKWVITMNLSAETENLDNAISAINAQIAAMNGYVENQNVTNASSYRSYRSASLTVRVPAEHVDSFVSEISGMTNVTSSSRNVRDITLAYTDTEGHLTALRTEEKRLLELMEKAEDMSDLLAIESRLTDVRYQLESYGSQLRLYDNQVDYATVDLYITEVKQYTPVEKPGFWQRITDGFSESLVDLGETLVDCAVWFIVDLPYLAVLALIVWGSALLIRRSIRKRKAKKAAAAKN